MRLEVRALPPERLQWSRRGRCGRSPPRGWSTCSNAVPGRLAAARRVPSSRGLGHHPLKVETRVRTPLGLLCIEAGQQCGRSISVGLLRLGCPQAVRRRIDRSDDGPLGELAQRLCQDSVSVVGRMLVPKCRDRRLVSSPTHQLTRRRPGGGSPRQAGVAKIMEPQIRPACCSPCFPPCVSESAGMGRECTVSRGRAMRTSKGPRTDPDERERIGFTFSGIPALRFPASVFGGPTIGPTSEITMKERTTLTVP